ncbi:hypothetical protein QP162_19805 [Sphingomonas aurantiaca]|uniref:hypothetical protein n=1 Tax=Sphingomonas aurantiaca TaxID=185949 RepID=UPI002FE05BF0
MLGPALGVVPATAQTIRVQNTATLSFDDAASDSGIRTVPSNTVSLDVNRGKRPTTLSFRLAPPNYAFTGAKCQTAPTYAFTPAPIDGATFAAAPRVAALDVKADMILVLDNQAGNRDPAVRETSMITADIGENKVMLTLTETTPDSGIFAGGVPSTETGRYPELEPCEVRTRGAKITLSFTEDEFSFGSTASILIDPAGYTFDSRTGALVDGATVTLVDEAGQPATVFGDDGVSRYPSTMVTGESVTDASGRVLSRRNRALSLSADRTRPLCPEGRATRHLYRALDRRSRGAGGAQGPEGRRVHPQGRQFRRDIHAVDARALFGGHPARRPRQRRAAADQDRLRPRGGAGRFRPVSAAHHQPRSRSPRADSASPTRCREGCATSAGPRAAVTSRPSPATAAPSISRSPCSPRGPRPS